MKTHLAFGLLFAVVAVTRGTSSVAEADFIDLTNAFRSHPNDPLPGAPKQGMTAAVDLAESSTSQPIPSDVTAGYLVLLDSGDPKSAADRANTCLWSEAIKFTSVNGTQPANALVYSDEGEPSDTGFPASLQDAIFNPLIDSNVVFALEAAAGTSDYAAANLAKTGTITYHINSDPRTGDETNCTLPEPRSVVTLSLGMLIVLAYRRRRIG